MARRQRAAVGDVDWSATTNLADSHTGVRCCNDTGAAIATLLLACQTHGERAIAPRQVGAPRENSSAAAWCLLYIAPSICRPTAAALLKQESDIIRRVRDV